MLHPHPNTTVETLTALFQDISTFKSKGTISYVIGGNIGGTAGTIQG
jgi:hypothetical protein